jgi:hypothetical protein
MQNQEDPVSTHRPRADNIWHDSGVIVLFMVNLSCQKGPVLPLKPVNHYQPALVQHEIIEMLIHTLIIALQAHQQFCLVCLLVTASKAWTSVLQLFFFFLNHFLLAQFVAR